MVRRKVKMQEKQKQASVGVLVGRFQVHELHAGHRDLIRHVMQRHSKVVVVLGLAALPTSVSNPLDFEARKKMLLAEFPEITVLYIKDQPTDEAWSKKLDEIVGDVCVPGQSALLYGGRDSFASHYKGRFSVIQLEEAAGRFLSGTAVRREIAKSSVKGSPDFRAGVIWASQARYPTAFTAVDIAILSENRERLLLGRKPNETLFRFVGGFSDPLSDSFEDDARREVMEETGLDIGDMEYLGSRRVDDWRYRNEPDCIKTLFFAGTYLHGRPRAGDDIEEVRWFDLPPQDPMYAKTNLITSYNINPTHRPLLEMLGRHLEKTR